MANVFISTTLQSQSVQLCPDFQGRGHEGASWRSGYLCAFLEAWAEEREIHKMAEKMVGGQLFDNSSFHTPQYNNTSFKAPENCNKKLPNNPTTTEVSTRQERRHTTMIKDETLFLGPLVFIRPLFLLHSIGQYSC